jgi:hypothetical protein
MISPLPNQALQIPDLFPKLLYMIWCSVGYIGHSVADLSVQGMDEPEKLIQPFSAAAVHVVSALAVNRATKGR